MEAVSTENLDHTGVVAQVVLCKAIERRPIRRSCRKCHEFSDEHSKDPDRDSIPQFSDRAVGNDNWNGNGNRNTNGG
jgi:hypothetical protein